MFNSTIRKINKSKHKVVIYLILIVIFAAGLRTIRAAEQSRYDGDAYRYFKMAKDWSIGGAEYVYSNDHDIPPLLPFLESCGYYVGLSPESTGLLLGGILGSLMPIAAFIVILNIVDTSKREDVDSATCLDGKYADISLEGEVRESKFKMDNSFLAFFGAFLIAVHPYMIRISVSCMRECLYIPFLLFTVTFGVIAIKKQFVWLWGLVGVLGALMALTRREGVEIIIIFLVWLIVDIIRNCIFLEKKASTELSSKPIFYYVKIFLVFMFCFLPIVISVDNKLSKTNCTWSIVQPIVTGMELFKE
jgi:hypothetical protein